VAVLSIVIGNVAAAEPAPELYPRALAARPLGLPESAVEGSALLGLVDVGRADHASSNLFTIDPRARYSFGFAELELGSSLLLHDDTPADVTNFDSHALRSMSFAGRYLPTREVSIGAELSYVGPQSAQQTAGVRLVVAHKRHFGRGALEFAFAAGVDRDTFDLDAQDIHHEQGFYVASDQLRAQVQATPLLAFEALFKGTYYSYKTPPSSDVVNRPDGFYPEVGARMVASITADLDLLVGFDIVFSPDDTQLATFTLGIAARQLR
jgi:hypothetical protein